MTYGPPASIGSSVTRHVGRFVAPAMYNALGQHNFMLSSKKLFAYNCVWVALLHNLTTKTDRKIKNKVVTSIRLFEKTLSNSVGYCTHIVAIGLNR